MYRFQVNAPTQIGEVIGIVGSVPELGQWDVSKCLRLTTDKSRYPLWQIEVTFNGGTNFIHQQGQPIEYKYIRFREENLSAAVGAGNSSFPSVIQNVVWESAGVNRWVPYEKNYASVPNPIIIVDDGHFDRVQPFPYGYFAQPPVNLGNLASSPSNLTEVSANGATNSTSKPSKIMILGSSVAMGCSAWLLQGWAYHLGQVLKQTYGHEVINCSSLGANVTATIERFADVVVPQQPDMVIIALSLGNEGLAYCAPHHRRAVQRRFESGLQQLVKMVRAIGAQPVIAGLYPHGDYTAEHGWLLHDTHARLPTWNVPMLDWLSVLDNGQGAWRSGLSFDVGHPNTLGHQKMYAAIDLNLFALGGQQMQQQYPVQKQKVKVFADGVGFSLEVCPTEKTLRIVNQTSHVYTIANYWQELQTSLREKAHLMAGVYVPQDKNAYGSFFVAADGAITSRLIIPPNTDITYRPVFDLFAPQSSQVLFYDGSLALLREDEYTLRIINETEHEYNIQPMWKEVRQILKAMPIGVYGDMLEPDAPFRTMIIGEDGLESRVKAPPLAALTFKFKCKLSDISRVAILPLGDRCGARMMLYKMQYDGPAFPFDLTRSTNLGDVADILANDFADMWNPRYLTYSPNETRLYHTKWSGLSFGHEVEDSDNPLADMTPVYERMRVRYSSRAARFRYAIHKADEILFIRTGGTERGYVCDLVNKLKQMCQGKPFRVLLLANQDPTEFADIPHVLHYPYDFSPDQMYADLNYWLECTETLRQLLVSLGITTENLFWCPPNPKPVVSPTVKDAATKDN